MRFVSAFLFLICLSPFLHSQNALDLDGTNDYVQTSYQGILGTAPRTVEAWINTTANANPSNGGVQQIITDWGTFVTGGRFTFNVLWSNAIRLEVGGNGVSGTIPVNDGNWHHVAGVWDPTAANTVSLYVDGVLDTANNLTVPLNTVGGTGLRIGQRVDNARRFDGAIDEVRVWNYARTQAEIQADMGSEFCTLPNGLVAYYTCNQGVASGNNAGLNTLMDFAPGGNDGTLTNFALNGGSSNWVSGAAITPGISFNQSAVAACDSFFWAGDSTTYTSSGTYTATLASAAGCDSIVELDLTINTPSQGPADTVATCNVYVWPVTGMPLFNSGDYDTTLTNAAGCDSTVSLNLTINLPDTTDLLVAACDSFFWSADSTVYTSSGYYLSFQTNAAGCDSLVYLDLTIDTLNNSVTDGGLGMLSAVQAGASYQWLQCDSGFVPISGATGQSYQATQNGSYAVAVTVGTCTDTSSCEFVVAIGVEDGLQHVVRAYPNPSRGSFVLDLGARRSEVQVRVLDVVGRTVFEGAYEEVELVPLAIAAGKGLYFVEVEGDGGVERLRVLVE